jgi:hypothetical protein
MEEMKIDEKIISKELMAIQKEMLMENKRLRLMTGCLIVLTILLVMEPATSYILALI